MADAEPVVVAQVDARAGRELVLVDTGPTLEQRAASINAHIEKYCKADASSMSHRLRAGQELVDARKNVPHGEWISWCEANIRRSRQDIARLMKMAGSDDPEAALEQEREHNREDRAERSNVTSMLHTDPVDPVDENVATPDQYRTAFYMRASTAGQIAFYPDEGPEPDEGMIAEAKAVARRWGAWPRPLPSDRPFAARPPPNQLTNTTARVMTEKRDAFHRLPWFALRAHYER